MNKVQAEISSGSEIDGIHRLSALSLPVEIHQRAHSVPPSPSNNDIRSPHSTSSNQGSDSLSSSDLHLSEFGLKLNRRNRPKVSSADSILAMFKNFASTNNNMGSLASCTIISPSTTPTASSPQDDVPGDDESSTSSIHTPISFSSGPSDSPIFYRQNQIEIPVLDALSAHKTHQQTNNQNLLHPPIILLEIPRDGNISKCLSPIRELPTPMPSPALTPIMARQRSRTPSLHDDPLSAATSFSDDELLDADEYEQHHNEFHKMNIIEDDFNRSVNTELENQDFCNNLNEVKKTRLQMKMPPIQISIDIDPPTPPSESLRNLVIPVVTVEQPSPVKNRPVIMFPGSPPPQRASIGETSFSFPNKQQQKRLLKQFDKPTSLDLPFAPPMITISSNLNDLESEPDCNSPAQIKQPTNLLLGVPGSSVGMCYLSPFSICTRGDRTISDSNLSSSGYSSMASPGPSRCGSSNPLCPSETEDPGHGHGHGLSFNTNLHMRRQVLKTCPESSHISASNSDGTMEHNERRGRSDSETMSDDPLLESNDEGIGTDHLDERIEDSEIKSAKDLEMYIGKEFLDNGKIIMGVEETLTMSQLQLPSIVILNECGEKPGLSPVSSRSESPLSERFSPLFYGKKDQQLPFTDSDGLYDFPSSDGKGSSNVISHRKNTGKRRERKNSRAGLLQSPSKTSSVHLEIPGSKEHSGNNSGKHQNTMRKSPKRRPIQRHPVSSSSSSSESITSAREMAQRVNKGTFY